MRVAQAIKKIFSVVFPSATTYMIHEDVLYLIECRMDGCMVERVDGWLGGWMDSTA